MNVRKKIGEIKIKREQHFHIFNYTNFIFLREKKNNKRKPLISLQSVIKRIFKIYLLKLNSSQTIRARYMRKSDMI